MIDKTEHIKPKILIVIPLYNHGETVYEVARRSLAVHGDVLIIDDGSRDLPEAIFQGLDVKIIRHEENLGKGAAIMTAAKEATKCGFTHIITIDADLQHIPEEIDIFKSAILNEPDAIYVGKRDFTSSNIPGSSNYGRDFSNFWYRVQTGRKIGDAQSGFRAYPVSVLNELTFSDKRYSFEVEVLVRATWANVPVNDIDIAVFYPKKGERISHFSLLKDNMRLTHLNARLTIRSCIPIPHKEIFASKKADLKFSILKPLKSIRLFLANDLSPYKLALAGAIGVFLGTLPLIGLHTIIVLLIAGFFKLNKIVAVGMSQFCMPPIVPAICIQVGYFLCHNGKFLTELSLKTLGSECLLRLYEWFLGSLVVAPVLSVAVFFGLYITAKILKTTSRFKLKKNKVLAVSNERR